VRQIRQSYPAHLLWGIVVAMDCGNRCRSEKMTLWAWVRLGIGMLVIAACSNSGLVQEDTRHRDCSLEADTRRVDSTAPQETLDWSSSELQEQIQLNRIVLSGDHT
jgi:hypothetical protein